MIRGPLPSALVEEDSLPAEKGKLAMLKPIDPSGGGRMHNRIRAIESLKRRLAAAGRIRLHICGNTRRILAGMGKLGCELVDLYYPVTLRQAREIMGPDQVLAGNIELSAAYGTAPRNRWHRRWPSVITRPVHATSLQRAAK
jgi:uroporphyrinogen-III decarboxylase